jgi:uncharacterized tellurite resistance protein B-like protein
MWQAVVRLLNGDDNAAGGPTHHTQDELRLAVAGLLSEAALRDGDFSQSERRRLTELTQRHFGMSAEDAEQLAAKARQKAEDAVDIYVFTRQIIRGFDETERLQLIEMLWDVVYADGRMDDLEANLLRRVAGLLGISDRESGLARQRVAARRAGST